jgi:hypothetical protein
VPPKKPAPARKKAARRTPPARQEPPPPSPAPVAIARPRVYRSPDEIRDRLRQGFGERIPALEEIADGVLHIALRQKCDVCGHVPTDSTGAPLQDLLKLAPTAADRLRAIGEMGKHAMEPNVGEFSPAQLEEIRRRMTLAAEQVRAAVPAPHYSPELAERLSLIVTLPDARTLDDVTRLLPAWREHQRQQAAARAGFG